MTSLKTVDPWRILMLLFHKHGVTAEDALRWLEDTEFALQASLKVGQNTTEGMRLLQRRDMSQQGQQGGDTSQIWYECA
jgi:hypothetical protein